MGVIQKHISLEAEIENSPPSKNLLQVGLMFSMAERQKSVNHDSDSLPVDELQENKCNHIHLKIRFDPKTYLVWSLN